MFIKASFLYFFYIIWVYKSICIMSILISFFLSLFSSIFYGYYHSDLYKDTNSTFQRNTQKGSDLPVPKNLSHPLQLHAPSSPAH